MGRKLLFASIAVLMATSAFASSTDQTQIIIPQDPYTWEGQEPSNVLLIQDQLGWGYDSHVMILNTAGVPYDVINSGQIVSWDFSQYDKIITVGDQPDNYYFAIEDNLPKFEDYMTTGGCCSFETSNSYQGAGNEQIVWPGGFQAVFSTDNVINIDDQSSCLMNGVAWDELQNWSWSSHGSFTYLPGAYVSVLSMSDGRTCAGFFPFGDGGAFISHQPLEWGYGWGYSVAYPTNFDLCECCAPTATEETNWGAVKSLYR